MRSKKIIDKEQLFFILMLNELAAESHKLANSLLDIMNVVRPVFLGTFLFGA